MIIKIMLIVFLVVGTLIALATLAFSVTDMIRERKAAEGKDKKEDKGDC